MNAPLGFALLLTLSGPTLASDLVVTREKHTDAATIMGQAQPAQDSTEVLWIGKDHMRVEEGTKVTIVRADLKKMYILDTEAKTSTTLDLPMDLMKYMPAEIAPRMKEMMDQMKVTVTPTTETKKVKDWNATRYTMTMTLPMGATMTQETWVTTEIAGDQAGWQEMYGAMMSANPAGAGMAAEMKKLAGFPVLTERTQTVMSSEVKSREAVVSVEHKEPAAGLYDVPAGYTEKAFDPMGQMGQRRMGAPGRGPRGG